MLRVLCFLLLTAFSFSTLFSQAECSRIEKVFAEGKMVMQYTYLEDGRLDLIYRYNITHPEFTSCFTAKDALTYGHDGNLLFVDVYGRTGIGFVLIGQKQYKFDDRNQLVTIDYYEVGDNSNALIFLKTTTYEYEEGYDYPIAEITYDFSYEVLEEIYYNVDSTGSVNLFERYDLIGGGNFIKPEFANEGRVYDEAIPWYLRSLFCKRCEYPLLSLSKIDPDTGGFMEETVRYEIEYNKIGMPVFITSHSAEYPVYVYSFKYKAR